MKSIYLAGPIAGCDDRECLDWRIKVQNELSSYYRIRSPMDRDYRGHEFDYTEDFDIISDIVKEDKKDVEETNITLVNFSRPSVGTSMEVIHAFNHNKTVIVISNGNRLSPWLVYHSDHICDTLEDAIELLKLGAV